MVHLGISGPLTAGVGFAGAALAFADADEVVDGFFGAEVELERLVRSEDVGGGTGRPLDSPLLSCSIARNSSSISYRK